MASVRDGRLEAAWLSQREAGGTETQRDSWVTSHVGGQKHCVLEQLTPCGTPVWILLWLAGSVWKILQALPEPPAPRCLWTTFAQNLNWGLHLTPTLKGGGLLLPGSAPSSQAPPARPAGLQGVGCSQVGLASLHCKPPWAPGLGCSLLRPRWGGEVSQGRACVSPTSAEVHCPWRKEESEVGGGCWEGSIARPPRERCVGP